MSSGATEFRFAIDRGGTFTDIFADWVTDSGDRKHTVVKLLSEDPSNYANAPREGIRRVLERITGLPHPSDAPVDTSRIQAIRMGTTVATNALLERKGERTALLITRGFRDLLQIGNQSRAEIFDLRIERPDLLYERVVEVDERIRILARNRNRPLATNQLAVERDAADEAASPCIVETTGVTGETVKVLQVPSAEALRPQLQALLDAGIRSLGVAFAHSYAYPDHEVFVGNLAKDMGFTHISLSSAIMPMVKLVPRAYTTIADAYLTPCIRRYLDSFTGGFDEHLLSRVNLLFMQSDGGLAELDRFSGFRAILSGPAGGVVGYALTTKPMSASHVQALDTRATDGTSEHKAEDAKSHTDAVQVIGFDMGGTSTDVSRYDGHYEHVFENTTAGVTIQTPQLDVNTVAAGGGSRLFFRSGLFVVGPDSAGAHPGPACYRKGGPLCITDANLFLGRLLPEHFPKIFGESQDLPLDIEASKAGFEVLTAEVNTFYRDQAEAQGAPKHIELSAQEVAYGFLRVANEAMCRPIRALTQARGYDIAKHVLACFGGAGGQHAVDIEIGRAHV